MRYNVPMTEKPPVKMVTCPQCTTRFKTRRPHQKFDTAKCRLDYWISKHPRINLEDKP